MMQTHADIGTRILSAGNARLLQLAEEVEGALSELERQSSKCFDPARVAAYLEVVGPKGRLSRLQAPDDWRSTLSAVSLL